MKKLRATIIALIFFMCVFVLVRIYISNTGMYQNEQRQVDREQAIAELQEKKATLEKEKGRKLTKDEELALLPAKAQRYIRLGKSMDQQAITFYGKVVDQYGEPVEGGEIRLSLGANAFSGGSQMRLLTDKDGRFVVNDVSGSLLGINGFLHPDTETIKHYAATGQLITGQLFYGFQPTVGANKLLWTDHQTSETAYIFETWRKGKSEGVIRVADTAVLSEDGELYTIDLVNKKIVKGVGDGHLRVRFNVEPRSGEVDRYGQPIYRYPRDWWAEIEMIEGGIQAVSKTDVFLNRAPETGYSNRVKVEYKKTDQSFKYNLWDQRYYIKANDNSYYGQLTLHYKPIKKSKKPELEWALKLNRNGSPNLEYFKKTGL